MTLVAVHQPNFLPYSGFFYKMLRADVFVFYDTAQYSRNDYHNRNRIKGPTGSLWLTVPVRSPSLRPIREVEISDARPWQARLWKTIEANYARAACFSQYAPRFREILLGGHWRNLVELNTRLIDQVRDVLEIKAETVLASHLRTPPSTDPSEHLRDMVRAVGGDAYLSGPTGRAYLDRQKFGDIRVEFADPPQAPYPQLWGPYLPNLSILDAVLNCGAITRNRLFGSDWPGREGRSAPASTRSC